MPISHVVFDIETALDEDAVARAYNLSSAAPEAVKASLGDSFPPPAFHRVVAIAAASLDYNLDLAEWSVSRMATLHATANEEADLIGKFFALLDHARPTVVGYNIVNFDIPVLRARAMLHRMKASHLSYLPRRGYGVMQIDLCDKFSTRGRDRMSLDKAARTYRVGAKTEGMDGSKVEDLARRGELTKIADYCLDDVIATAGLFLLQEILEGRINQAGYERGQKCLHIARERTLRVRPASFV